MELKAGRDWRSILLAIVSTGSAILAVALAVIVVVLQAAMKLGGNQQNPPLIDTVLLASAILFIGALFISRCVLQFPEIDGRRSGR